MKTRIGLFTPKAITGKKKDVSTDSTFIDAEGLDDVMKALKDAGAKRVGLFWRDRLGAGHLEGELFPVAGLNDSHLAWIAEKSPEYQMRGLFYKTT